MQWIVFWALQKTLDTPGHGADSQNALPRLMHHMSRMDQVTHEVVYLHVDEA